MNSSVGTRTGMDPNGGQQRTQVDGPLRKETEDGCLRKDKMKEDFIYFEGQ